MDPRDMTSHPDGLQPRRMPIIGFDVLARAWMVAADAAANRTPLPLLGGQLVVDVAAQTCAIDDAGHPAQHLIAAMLLPSGVEDIVRMIRFCDEHGIVVLSPNAGREAEPGPIVRIHADALGRQRPMLRVVGSH